MFRDHHHEWTASLHFLYDSHHNQCRKGMGSIIIYVGGVDGEYWWAKIVARRILGKPRGEACSDLSPASGNRSCLLKRHLIIKATRSACHDSASDSLALALYHRPRNTFAYRLIPTHWTSITTLLHILRYTKYR
jgi:hypothetical protein